MPKYTATATMYDFLRYEFEAEDEDDAWNVAELAMLDGLFEEYDGDYEITEIVEIKEKNV